MRKTLLAHCLSQQRCGELWRFLTSAQYSLSFAVTQTHIKSVCRFLHYKRTWRVDH